MESLNLMKLNRINSGAVYIAGNKKLCFGQNIYWDNIMKNKLYGVTYENNRNSTECRELLK